MKSSNIHNVVMRRVYYSYALSFFGQVVFWQGMFLGAAALLLAKWLHVAKIIDNFLSVPVGQAPRYAFDAITGAWMHGEVMMVCTFILAGAVAVSAGYHVAQALLPRLLSARPV